MEKEGLNLKMQEVRQMAEAKGFSADEERIWEMLALIHSEISEATDAYKKGIRLGRLDAMPPYANIQQGGYT